uniref:Uncharacterized protein n=1 Tax=Arundo donax TaxID=35708 RepID=A0A0A9E4J5_ARUDO
MYNTTKQGSKRKHHGDTYCLKVWNLTFHQ